MSSSFEPQTPFEGFVFAKLENIEKKFDSLPCPDSLKRLNKVENEVSNIKGRATVFGAIAGIVSAWIAKYVLGK